MKLIDPIFQRTISHVLELSEGLFSEHPQWSFYRKVLLKRLNDLKREVTEINKEREGMGNESNNVRCNSEIRG